MKSFEERCMKSVRSLIDDLVDEEIEHAKSRINERLAGIHAKLPFKARIVRDAEGEGFTLHFDVPADAKAVTAVKEI